MSGVESNSPLTIKTASKRFGLMVWLIKESNNLEINASPLYVGIMALMPFSKLDSLII